MSEDTASTQKSRRDEILSYEGFVYPGYEGIPFRSKKDAPPDLKKEDPDPEIVVDAKIRVLDLTKEDDLMLYEFIWDQCAKRRFVHPSEERQYDPELKGWRVLIRFGVQWLEMPIR